MDSCNMGPSVRLFSSWHGSHSLGNASQEKGGLVGRTERKLIRWLKQVPVLLCLLWFRRFWKLVAIKLNSRQELNCVDIFCEGGGFQITWLKAACRKSCQTYLQQWFVWCWASSHLEFHNSKFQSPQWQSLSSGWSDPGPVDKAGLFDLLCLLQD